MQRGKKKKAEFKDVALVLGQTEDRKGYQILRKRADEDTVEMGTINDPLKPTGRLLGSSSRFVRSTTLSRTKLERALRRPA